MKKNQGKSKGILVSLHVRSVDSWGQFAIEEGKQRNIQKGEFLKNKFQK